VNPPDPTESADSAALVVMGVAGSGKTTLGCLLADALGATFLDGDDFHPPANVEKMRAGLPLDDADRDGWLARLAAELAAHRRRGAPCVLACSALKRRYRDRLRAATPALRFIHPRISPAVAAQRVAGRSSHYMPASLVASQFAAFESPQGEPGVLELDGEHAPQALLDEVTAWLTRPAITGLLLAAGLGRRYDPSGAALKLLAPAPGAARGDAKLASGTPLAVAAWRNLRSVLDDVLVVLRPAGDDPNQQWLRELLRSEGAATVTCADAALGMGHTLACGVAARPQAAGWLVALADMPALAPATIATVAACIVAGDAAAAPMHDGQRGHPVGFGRACHAELLALTGDSGARSVLSAHPPRLVPVDDPGCLLDIDRP
jgi:gluconokinase